MRVIECARDLAGDPHRIFHRQLLFSRQAVPQGFAGNERHDVEHCAIHLAGIVQPQDMGVLQVGRGRDFVEEPVCSDHRCEFGPQHLERDFAPVLHIFREVYGGHSSGAKLALDPVPLEECRVQAIQRGGHAVKDAALKWLFATMSLASICRRRHSPSLAWCATIAVAARYPVELSTVAKMSGIASTAIRIPMPSTGRPMLRKSGASTRNPPRGTPGAANARMIDANAIVDRKS